MKKKPLIITIALLAICAVVALIAYFLLRGGNNSDKYTELIPANAVVVSKIDMKALAESAGLEEMAKDKGNNLVPNALKKYVENPAKTGIDISAPVYLFVTKENNCMGIAIKPNNSNDFEDFLADLSEEKMVGKIKEIDDLKVAKVKGGGRLIFTDEAILYVKDNSDDPFMAEKKYMNLTKESQYRQTEDFKKLQATTDHVDLLLSYNAIKEQTGEYGDIIFTLPSNVSANMVKANIGCNFNKGAIDIKYNVYSDDANLQKQLQDFDKANNKKINGDYLALMGNNSAVFATGYVNGASVREALNNKIEALKKATKPGFLSDWIDEETLNSKSFAEIIAKIGNILNEMDGDAAISLGYNEEKAIPIDLNLAAKVKSAKFMADGDYWINQARKGTEGMVSVKKNDANTLAIDAIGSKVMAGVANTNTFYITTCANAKTMLAATPSADLNSIKSQITNSSIYARVNVKNLSTFIDELGDYGSYAKAIDNITYAATSPLEGSFGINLTNKDENSLKVAAGMLLGM